MLPNISNKFYFSLADNGSPIAHALLFKYSCIARFNCDVHSFYVILSHRRLGTNESFNNLTFGIF